MTLNDKLQTILAQLKKRQSILSDKKKLFSPVQYTKAELNKSEEDFLEEMIKSVDGDN